MKTKLKMKKNLGVFGILTLVVVLGACIGKNQKEVEKETKPEEKKVAMKAEKVLRHMVIFKFYDDAPEEEVEKINKSFAELKDHIPIIQDFEWGLNDSPEDFHQDFTHCYLLTFKSEEDRDSIYAPHPKHQEFVADLQPYLEKVFVVDYWAN